MNSKNKLESLYHKALNSNGIKSENRYANAKFRIEIFGSITSIAH